MRTGKMWILARCVDNGLDREQTIMVAIDADTGLGAVIAVDNQYLGEPIQLGNMMDMECKSLDVNGKTYTSECGIPQVDIKYGSPVFDNMDILEQTIRDYKYGTIKTSLNYDYENMKMWGVV